MAAIPATRDERPFRPLREGNLMLYRKRPDVKAGVRRAGPIVALSWLIMIEPATPARSEPAPAAAATAAQDHASVAAATPAPRHEIRPEHDLRNYEVVDRLPGM